MTLKTGMLVGIVGTGDIGVLIQIRSSSNSCVIKLNNGTLKKNVPLDDVEEAKDMNDTKENKSPIRLGEATEAPGKSPKKLASLSIDTRRSTDKLKSIVLDVGDAVRARCNGGSRWFPGKIIRVNRDGTYDVEYFDGDIEKKMAPSDVEIASKLDKPLNTESFAVGSKVKARYKNGIKLFNGKITRVRSDGTYDIKFDDGDVEMRVTKDKIESNRSDHEIPSSTKKKSSGFRVDQSVKARYKGGKKMFLGKIKRDHSDDTYDIQYEDGDEEKRVKAENIEAVEDPKADSDEEIKPKKTTSKKLAVGKKVKAHYKKGKKLFPGKISRVRSDGTYDIDYDDGEIETRVEIGQIEVDDDNMFADSDDDMKPSTSTKKKAEWKVGDRVKAFYGKGKRLFPGKIAKVHMNGTYDVKYDDGDSEVLVDASLIESAEPDQKPTKSKDSPISSSKKSVKRPLRVGDAVKAKHKRGTRFFPGKITRLRMDGTFDIKYEDGDVEEHVEIGLIQAEEGEDDTPKKVKKKSFEVGDVVKAPFQRGSKLFRGKISRVRSDGTYDVAFDDGDKDTYVPVDLIQSEEPDTHDENPKNKSLKVGDAVKVRYKKGKKLFAGKVARVRSDGTYDIEYDDGDVEMCVDIEMIEVPEGKKCDDEKHGSSKAKIKVGDKVRARYNKGTKMFSGEITAVHRDCTYDIRYKDGDKEKYVAAKDIELQEEERESEPPKKSSSTLKVGDIIEASYKNGVKMFPGKISRVHSDGTYDITFNDGDSERRVPRSRIKSKAVEKNSLKKKSGFAVGDAVKAKYKKGTKYFSGKIARVRSDGTYDIEYDDGDSELRVNVSLIIAAESENGKMIENSPKSASKTKRFDVGDVIKARYKKGSKLFSGKIIRVRSDGTYDVRYDDGDTEMYVESSYIEGEEKLSSRDKKPEGFAVGDKVNAKYKGGLKSFPAKIVKARLDGTFDVEYDDGDTAQRVKSSSIELISGSKTKKTEVKTKSEKDDLFGDSDSDGKAKTSGNKKSVSLKIGDIVEANFKQKGKFHRGKIVRVRSDGTFDIEYDVGASEKHVRIDDIKKGDNQEKSDDSDTKTLKKKPKPKSDKHTSDSDREPSKPKQKKSTKYSSSESSGSDRERQTPIKKGARVTYLKAEDSKSRRIGIARKVHSDGSCDVKYSGGDRTKRVARKLLVECSDSEDSDDELPSKRPVKATEGPAFRRHECVLSNWRRSSKLSKPRMTETWSKATVLEKNSDGTYTIRYSDGVVEEDVPSEALMSTKKKSDDSDSDGSSKASNKRRKRKLKRTNGIGTESLLLLEQLAMTLFEEGVLKKKPKLQLLRDDNDSSSSSSSSSSTESGSSSSKSHSNRNGVDKVLKRLFDSSSLQNYRQMFKENDVKNAGKISRSRIISLVEKLMVTSKPTKGNVRDDSSSVSHILTEWFATHDDLRSHRHFEFKTLMLAFAYAKCRLGKLRMERSVATVLEGRFASYHENKRQLELWQQKLGYRLFETLQRHFHDHALPNMIPSRIRVSELSLIVEQVARQAMPNKPLDVYLQQHQLFPHQTLLLPEFLCCYYQLYGSEHSTSLRWNGSIELRPISFVASCLFSNGDNVCKRHGDLVRRLSVGRTQAQVDLILRFREAFESLLSTDTDGDNSHEELLLETSQLSAFAAKVAPDPSQLEPAMTTLRKRSGAASLVEIYGTCGFIIDELTSAPTIRNAIEKMRMRVDLAEVRRIIGLVRNICVKILRFPNNADYWRIRASSEAFQQKIGRFDGATSLLEAVGFVEHQKTHYELRGARNSEGKRVSALGNPTLDVLREKCVQLDGELSLFDGVESISSILQRISKACKLEGNHFTLEECQSVLMNLSSYIENVLKNPKDSRCWRIREANSTFQRQIGYLPYAMELMESVGFDLVQTSHGNVYTLRGTGMTGESTKNLDQPSASLSNFAFTSVSSQMEWFLYRRKQEIDRLLEDEMRYLHDIVGQFSQSQNNISSLKEGGERSQCRSDSTEARDAVLVKMYPYGTNAIETFNKTSVQRLQLDMMRQAFNSLDVDQKGFLLEADFSRVYGAPSSIPIWSQFEAFDIGKDGKVDIHDFVAALGPLLDHSYELTTDKREEKIASFSGDDTNPTLCEVVSLAVGNLRLETSCAAAATVLESLLSHLYSIIQEPGNSSLWSINNKAAVGSKLLRFAGGRELLCLVGFRESSNSVNENTRSYELQPQRVRFKTSNSTSELPESLDSATIARIQTIAAMLSGHYRGLKNTSVSDISAVSRAISAPERESENWSRVVHLAVKCLTNVENHPENPRYREINTATNTFTKIVGCVQGGLELLLSIGFRETDSGTLIIPSDTSLDVLKARRLEFEVGLALLHLKLTKNNNSTVIPQQSTRGQSIERNLENKPQPAFGSKDHLEHKKKLIQTAKLRPQTKKQCVGSSTHGRPATAVQRQPTKMNTKSIVMKQRPQSAKTFTDPIEKEILADFPHKEMNSRDKMLNRGKATASTLSRKSTNMRNDRAMMSRKQVQRRIPNKPPPANGHTMVLAVNATAGTETIVVQKGQFLLRGVYIRIGAEIRELYEERMVVDVSSTDEGLTKLRLGIPLRFFHLAKELVSTVLLSSAELAKRLEVSDSQTFVREIIADIVVNIVDQMTMNVKSCQPKAEMEPQITKLLVTLFEPMAIVPMTSSNIRVGPSMRYLAVWNDSLDSSGVSIFNDPLSDHKLRAYWEGLLLQAGTSNKKVRLEDAKQIIHRNAYLSLLLSIAGEEIEEDKLGNTKSDDFQVNYEGFLAFFHLPPAPKDSGEEDTEARLQLPITYLSKHFQILLQTAATFTNGFKSVSAYELLHRVYKDVQDHHSVVSDDPNDNHAGLEITKAVCEDLERAFVNSQRIGQISWPELVYFVRYNKRLTTPEVFPSTSPQLILDVDGNSSREVAEVVSGTHSSRLLVLYFDGSVEVWNLSSGNAAQESKASVLFSTKKNTIKRKGSESEQGVNSKSFMEAWMDANQTSQNKQEQRCSARIHQFIRSTGTSGSLVHFCAWDSVICVNSSILQEPGSGSFRFFRLAKNFVNPLFQVTVEHIKVRLSTASGRKSDGSTKKGESTSFSGVVRTFEVTTDGSKIVFLKGSEAILWVACARTGEVLCHANLQASQMGKFRSLFQVIDKVLPCGEIQTHLYATTSATSSRHAGMWILPQSTEKIKSFERETVFSFGKSKTTTVVNLVVSADFLLVTSRNGTIIVWSTSIEHASPASPLVSLQIPLRNEELQSICCQSFQQKYSGVNSSLIQVEDNAAEDINLWETEGLQRFDRPPLRFALYLFEDNKVIRLPVPDTFDVRLVTLDDPAFEYDVFLTRVSGVEYNPARRVALQKHQIIRVLFIALHRHHNGIFAQKSVQEFFQDLENNGILWKTRDEMTKFALSYHENVVVKFKPFYRRGDGELVELTQPQHLTKDSLSEEIQDTNPVLVIGAVLKSRAGNQTQFQAWKFATNSLTDVSDSEQYRLNYARQSLALQSSYRLEAERVRRIRNDTLLEEQMKYWKSRRTEMVQGIKDGIRDIITHDGRIDETADKLLKAVNVFMLASFDYQIYVDPVEEFFFRVFRQGQSSHVQVSSLIKLIRKDEGRSICFDVLIDRITKEVLAVEELDRGKNISWNWLSLVVRHIEACSLTTAELGALFVDLGLTNVCTNLNSDAKQLESSIPSFMQQLYRFLSSRGTDKSKSLTLESIFEEILPPRVVVEFIVECTNFSSFFQVKMADLMTRVTALIDIESEHNNHEASYATKLKIRRWQKELRQLSQSQNELHSEISGDGDLDKLNPSIEDFQQLQRFLKTPLPCVSPKVSSITLETRCDTIRCRDRFVMNARGRLEGVGSEFVPLSMFYLFIESGAEGEQKFQQELTFLRKVQHLRVREFFLPACLDSTMAPIFPTANGSMICADGTDEIQYIVAESMNGWSSLTDCLKFMRLSKFSMDDWKPLLWYWCIRVLMMMLTMENERFTMREGIDMDMLLVSPDGNDLRLCSLSGGSFVRFGENEDTNSLNQETTKVFGCFIYNLLCRAFTEDNGSNWDFDEDLPESIGAGVDDEALRKMRNRLIRLYSSGGNYDDQNNRSAFLTDFSSVSQITSCGEGIQKGKELESLCEFALMALQPANTRPGLQSLWMYAGRPGMEIFSEESVQLRKLLSQLMTLVGLQRPLQQLLQDLRLCMEECDDEVCSAHTLQRVVERWKTFLEQLFQLKAPATDCGDKGNTTNARIFAMTLRQIRDNQVPYQLGAISLQIFTLSIKHGDREEGHQVIETLLNGFTDVLELVEAHTNFNELHRNSLLISVVQQILDNLTSLVSGRIRSSAYDEDTASTSSRFHCDIATNVVLWRLSEPLFKNLLGIKMVSSKFTVLLRWLDSRRSPFGYAPILSIRYESSTVQHEIALWWSDHTPLIPRHSPSDDDLMQKGFTEGPMTAHYLRCVYETKEIEFNLTSGVSVPKFRLAALQQFFGPEFFDRKRCFPMVFVRPLVATVWKDLGFERLICTLFRDDNEKIVLGALSLLECSSRVFRFDPLRNPRIGCKSTDTQTPYTFSCPERNFALNLCSQSVVTEVKRILDKTTKALKVLGESGTSSASRSQHPLVAILCVGMAWLVNCLHGGDAATQFWGIAGVDQLVITHCKANSLPFVKIRDSNMMNQGQRVTHKTPVVATKWRLFTSRSAESLSHRSASRNYSPFRLMLEEIVIIGSNRVIGLLRMLLLSRTFREETAVNDNSSGDSAFQRDLISSSDYGKVSHAIDLARDITQLNGTINEQVQVILYTKALFLYHTATTARIRVSVFAPVCKEIWSWVETAWRNVVLHFSSNSDEKGVKLSRAQGEVVTTGFSLLHSIISHPALVAEDIIELATFYSGDDDKLVNVLHELLGWMINVPGGVARRHESTISVLVESGVALLTNSVHLRRYDEVSLATINTCVDIRALLKLLEMDCGSTIVTINEKQQLWSMVLYFDHRIVTSRILDMDFLDTAVFSRLDLNTENQSESLNQRLEAAMFLEILVIAASRRENSVDAQMLLAEACKLLLHHDIIAKEAAYVNKATDSPKHLAVRKRVIQLVCCLCVDFSSQSPSRVFLDQLESVGVPHWVVHFHQAQQIKDEGSTNNQLLTRVELFWKDWQGHGEVGKNSANREMVLKPTRKSKSEKTIVQTVPRLQRSSSQMSAHYRMRKNQSVQLETTDSDDDPVDGKMKRPLVSVSPVKVVESVKNPPQTKQFTMPTNTSRKKDPGVIQTLLSIDTDSALRLVKRATTSKKDVERQIDDEALDSDAYSPLSGNSSEEETQQRAECKASGKRKSSEEKKSDDSKEDERKLERDSPTNGTSDDSSRNQPRRRAKAIRKSLKKLPKPAVPPQNQQQEALRVIFRKYDVDGDGFISFIDLRRAMDKQTAGLGHRLSDVEIQRWITEKDKSGKGVISFEDFAVAFQAQVKL